MNKMSNTMKNMQQSFRHSFETISRQSETISRVIPLGGVPRLLQRASTVALILTMLFTLGVGEMWAWYVPGTIGRTYWGTTDNNMGSDNTITFYSVAGGTYSFQLTNGANWSGNGCIKSYSGVTTGTSGNNATITFSGTKDITITVVDETNWKVSVTATDPSNYFIKYPWDGSNWSPSGKMVANGDGTYSVTGAYHGKAFNYKRYNSDSDDFAEYNDGTSSVTIVGNTPSAGNNCVFTFKPSDNTLTIRKCNSVTKNNYIYFDNTTANWSTSYIYFVIGKPEYSGTYATTAVTNTKLRYVSYTGDSWSDCGYYAMIGANSTFGSGSWGPGNIYAAAKYSAPYFTPLNLESGYNYVVGKASATDGTAITMTKKGNVASALNSNQTIQYALSTDNGTSYSVMSSGNTPGAISVSAYKFVNGTYNSVSNTSNSQSISSNTSGTYSKSVPAAYTGETTLTASARDGYTFVGWKIGTTETAATSPAYPTAATTYTARYKANQYTISLNRQSGSGGPGSITVTYETNSNMTSAITKPTRDGYTFAGYYTLSYGSGKQIIDKDGNFNSAVTDYITDGKWTRADGATLYAYWKHNCSASAYTIRYFGDGVAYESSCFEQVGETHEWNISNFAIPSNTKYSVGYNEDVYDSDLGTGVTKSASVTQTWTDTYAQTDGIGNGAMQLLPAGASARAVGQATGALGTLVIWDNSADKNLSVGFRPNGYGVTTADDTYAFTAGSGTFYYSDVVTISSDEASGNFQVKLVTSDSYVACAQGTAEAASAVSARKISGDANIASGKKGVFQMWSDATANNFGLRFVTVYDVSFDMQGHGLSIADYKDVRYNDKIGAPTAPTATGYTFGGWYKEDACTNAWDFDNDVVTATTVLYAKWTANQHDITYTAPSNGTYTIKAGDASAVSASVDDVDYGTTITLAATPNEGYAFSGWTVTGASPADVSAATTTFSMPDNDVTVAAAFTGKTYPITYYDADTTEIKTLSPTTYVCGEGATLPTVVTTKAGYTFDGWIKYNNGSDRSKRTQIGTTSYGHYYFIATWKQTLTLDMQGVISNLAPTVMYDSTKLASYSPGATIRSGALLGYYTAPTDGTKVLNADGTFASSNVTDYITGGKWRKAGATTLYAHWSTPIDLPDTLRISNYAAYGGGLTVDGDTLKYKAESSPASYATWQVDIKKCIHNVTITGFFKAGHQWEVYLVNSSGTTVATKTFDALYTKNLQSETKQWDLSGISTAGTYTIKVKNITGWGDPKLLKVALDPIIVTYDANGGSCATTRALYTGSALTLPTPDSRSGYVFEGWYSGNTKIGNAGASYVPTAGITLTAKWGPIVDVPGTINKANVAYYSSDMTWWGDDDEYLDFGPTSAFNLDRWARWEVDVVPCEYTISTIAGFPDGGSNAIQWGLILFNGADTVATYNSIRKDGYTNITYDAKWDLTKDKAGNDLSAGVYTLEVKNIIKWGQPKMKSITLTPQTYTVSYAAGTYGSGSLAGGTKMACQSYTLSSADDAFTRAGHAYDGWSTSEDGSTKDYNLGGSYTTDESVTLYPHWTCATPPDPTDFTAGTITDEGVTFTITDAADAASYDIYYSTSSTAPTGSTDATTTADAKSKAITGLTAGTTYYAWVRAVCDGSHKSSWVALNPDGATHTFKTHYTVTMGTITTRKRGDAAVGGETASDVSHAAADATVTLTATPASGYGFVAWKIVDGSSVDKTDDLLGADSTLLNPSFTMPAYSVTVKATFATRYTIAYKETDKTTVIDGLAPTFYLYGTGVAALPTPEKIGYTFDSWYSAYCVDSEHGGEFDNGCKVSRISTSDYGNVTYYATWTANEYTITLDLQGADNVGEATDEITVQYGTNDYHPAMLTPAEKDANVFHGFWTGMGGTGVQVISKSNQIIAGVEGYTDGSFNWIHAGDVTLYAYWEELYIFTGATDNKWSKTANWANSQLPDITKDVYVYVPVEVDITNAAAKSVLLDQSSSRTGRLTIGAGKALVVKDSLTRTTDGSTRIATRVQDLYIASGSTGNGSLVVGNHKGTNQAQVDFYTLASKDASRGYINQHIGTPFASGRGVKQDYYGSYLYSWDAVNQKWSNIKDEDYHFTPFLGYNILRKDAAASMLELEGTLVATTDKVVSLTYNGGDKANNENVLANSWTAPIDIAAIGTSSFSNCEATIYIMNAGSKTDLDGAGAASASATNPAQWIALPVNSAPWSSPTVTKIPSMQGFLVYATGTSPTLTLNYTTAVYTPALANTTSAVNPATRAPRRTANDNAPEVIRLRVTGTSGYADQLCLLLREDFTDAFDNGWDGHKVYGKSYAPQLFSVAAEGEQMAVDCKPEVEGTLVGMKAGDEDEMYTMTFEYESDEPLYLLDVQTNTYTDMRAGNAYTFHTNDIGAHNRFVLTRFAPQMPTGVEEPASDSSLKGREKAMKFIEDNKMYILLRGVLYDATGKRVRKLTNEGMNE